MEADLLLMLATSFPYNDFLPKPKRCIILQIDQDPYQIGKRHSVDIGACADVRLAVPEITERCERKDERSWLKS